MTMTSFPGSHPAMPIQAAVADLLTDATLMDWSSVIPRQLISMAVDHMDTEMHVLRQANERLQSEVGRLQCENEDLRRRLADERGAAEDRCAEAVRGIRDRLKDELATAREVECAETARLKDKATDLEIKVEDLKRRLTDERRSRDGLEHELNDLREKRRKVETLKVNTNNEDRRIEMLLEIEALKSERDGLREAGTRMSAEKGRLEAELEMLRQALAERDSELGRESVRHGLLTRQFNSLICENERLKARNRVQTAVTSMTSSQSMSSLNIGSSSSSTLLTCVVASENGDQDDRSSQPPYHQNVQWSVEPGGLRLMSSELNRQQHISRSVTCLSSSPYHVLNNNNRVAVSGGWKNTTSAAGSVSHHLPTVRPSNDTSSSPSPRLQYPAATVATSRKVEVVQRTRALPQNAGGTTSQTIQEQNDGGKFDSHAEKPFTTKRNDGLTTVSGLATPAGHATSAGVVKAPCMRRTGCAAVTQIKTMQQPLYQAFPACHVTTTRSSKLQAAVANKQMNSGSVDVTVKKSSAAVISVGKHVDNDDAISTSASSTSSSGSSTSSESGTLPPIVGKSSTLVNGGNKLRK